MCGRPYLSIKTLVQHLKTVHNRGTYKCTISPCTFSSFQSEVIVQHYWDKHGTTEVPEEYRPIEESKRLSWGEKRKGWSWSKDRRRKKGNNIAPSLQAPDIKPHVEVIQSEDEEGKTKFRCRLCDFVAHKGYKKEINIANIVGHIKVKHLNFKVHCPEAGCSFSSGYEYNMSQHLLKVHHKEYITCQVPQCKFKTMYMDRMQNHQRIHNKEYITCLVPGCKYKTMYQEVMQRHQTIVHNAKQKTSIASKMTSVEISCMIPDCTFKTLDDVKMQLHLTNVHNAKYDEKTHSLVCFA